MDWVCDSLASIHSPQGRHLLYGNTAVRIHKVGHLIDSFPDYWLAQQDHDIFYQIHTVPADTVHLENIDVLFR